MFSKEKVRKFMWFSLGIALSLSILYFMQMFFGSNE